MDASELRQRTVAAGGGGAANGDVKPAAPDAIEDRPEKQEKGAAMQILRLLLFTTWFVGTCTVTHSVQLLGVPLYWINRDYYYAWMALTKQCFGLIITTITQWFSPTVIRVSGDKSIPGQLRLTTSGRLLTDFPERLVLIANHQLYTDWLYLWWIAYTNDHHGHIYILLRDNLRFIPIIGPGMMFFGFIFMARKWERDQSRMEHRLKQLKTQHAGPLSGSKGYDPMWLLLFPEGTNLSANTRKRSAAWAEKQGIPDFRNVLLPRVVGLQYALSQLKDSVDWVYDCTTYYDGTPAGGYAQDHFTLRSTYLAGRPPKSVNMHWRRFAMASIPVDDPKAFEQWVMRVWREKEEMLDYFEKHRHFPAEKEAISESSYTPKVIPEHSYPGVLDTAVQLRSIFELWHMFVIPLTAAILANLAARSWNLYWYGTFHF